jgi:hypothetical protein
MSTVSQNNNDVSQFYVSQHSPPVNPDEYNGRPLPILSWESERQ